MKSFLRRAGLLLGVLKAPGAPVSPSRAEPRESRTAELWLLLSLRIVLLLLIVGFALATSSAIWRVIALVVFCLLALGIGQHVKRLTSRPR